MAWLGIMGMNVEINAICRIMEVATVEGKRFEVGDIERVIGWDYEQWGKQFREQTGQTPARYARLFRLRLICKDLRETGATVGDVFTGHGMDVAHMQRQFKKAMGMTPYMFRKSSQEVAERRISRVFGDTQFQHDLSTSPPTLK